jgi:hypothetical protein
MTPIDPYKGLLLSGKNKVKSLLKNKKGVLTQRKLATESHPDDNTEDRDIESMADDNRVDDNSRSSLTARPTRVSTPKPMGMATKPFSSPKREMAGNVDAKKHITEARKPMTEKVSGIAPKFRNTVVSDEKEWSIRGKAGPKADKIIKAINKARKTGRESDYRKALLSQKTDWYHKENDRFVNKSISKLAGNFEPEYIQRFGTMKQKIAMAAKGLGKESTINKDVAMEATPITKSLIGKFKAALKNKKKTA